MIKRYANKEIEQIFGDANKTSLWQEIEIAVILVKESLGMVPRGIGEKIKQIWDENPIDLEWWKNKDAEIHHDLNAFILERVRHLPNELQQYVHDKMTSFDTEETPFLQMLHQASKIVDEKYQVFQRIISNFAKKNRFTVMIARTHGQEAELKSLGARALSWLVDMDGVYNQFCIAQDATYFSKISGAVGNYGSISPKVEKETLSFLSFRPFYGATQILPRSIHASLAQALCNLALVLDKIANDVRLNARSGRPLLQEPFKKTQTGSSAMPQKKNPIQLEQVEGMARLAKSYTLSITENIRTWEERAIEQSCVERVAWPDLFSVVARILDVMQKIFSNLTVYRDNMLQEIVDARGTYASSEAKEFLKKHLSGKVGLGYEDCYRLVQLACFNVFEEVNVIDPENKIPIDLKAADFWLDLQRKRSKKEVISIETIIPAGQLRVSSQLVTTSDDVTHYNELLKELFKEEKLLEEWHELFKPSFLLKNEEILFREILG
ncbi:MAG: lyase family protein [Patescibacteria group bacterium]